MRGATEIRGSATSARPRIGLVLSGGGGKGTYQLGALRALEEHGLAPKITAISGCSIGAYNALLYACGGIPAAREFMFRFHDLMKSHQETPEHLVEARRQSLSGPSALPSFETDPALWKYRSSGLRAHLNQALETNRGGWRKKQLYACAYCLEQERPAYFRLGDLSDTEAVNVVVASGTLPYTFPPVRIGAEYYTDGGVVPDLCRTPAPCDKIPLRPILQEDLDLILVIFLNPLDQVDHTSIQKGVQYLELRPSTPLEPAPRAGTLDFQPDHLRWREELGYRDAIELLSSCEGESIW
ncbi:MAG: hypothetical protein HFF50_10285 [Lawsonibacter sp.]|nr:hypothetical protein [Lawsonibacter sp.]